MLTTTSATATPAPRPKVLHVQDPDAPHIHCAADFPAEPVRWLWPGRIPVGSITLLAGDPGTGKSLFAIELAARISTASPWPDEPPPFASPLAPSATTANTITPPTSSCVFATPTSNLPPSTLPLPPSTTSTGSVLILSASDPLPDTIRPRLDAAGADPSRVFLLGNITNLRTDMEKLRQAIDETRDLRLLIIDPINFFVGPGDAHFQTVVRSVLEPLAELARKKKFAILAITHFRKNDGAAIRRAAGSMGFVATARTIWTLAADPHDPSRRELLPLKNNLTQPIPGLAFHITNTPLAPPTKFAPSATTDPQHPRDPSAFPNSQSPHLLWDPTPLNVARGSAPPPPKPQPSTPRTEAQHYLRAALADGPRPASELLDLADARGLTRRTVQRAFHDLEGCTTKRGFQAGWWWSLGEYPIAPIPDYPEIDPLAEPAYATDVADKIAELRMNAQLLRTLASKPHAHPHQQPASPQKNLSPSPNVSPSPIAAGIDPVAKSPAAKNPDAADESSLLRRAVAFAPPDAFVGSFTRAWLLADDHAATPPIRNHAPAPVPSPQSHFPLHLTPTPAY